ncbi:unnamed protein product [Heterosigma akashiwo]|mmetsp:Transcript_19381/g.33998  ORF Transcript_19381/g.33998 Transcript_19381/m.33998 type:complete len:148 (-) Transcript_19381:240-683(-)
MPRSGGLPKTEILKLVVLFAIMIGCFISYFTRVGGYGGAGFVPDYKRCNTLESSIRKCNGKAIDPNCAKYESANKKCQRQVEKGYQNANMKCAIQIASQGKCVAEAKADGLGNKKIRQTCSESYSAANVCLESVLDEYVSDYSTMFG